MDIFIQSPLFHSQSVIWVPCLIRTPGSCHPDIACFDGQKSHSFRSPVALAPIGPCQKMYVVAYPSLLPFTTRVYRSVGLFCPSPELVHFGSPQIDCEVSP
ncbi:hypothetical protein FRC12_014417 [Ceratobasidium sp. 428]|nr:hypothetical protein FRC12_014417 [Ceratobasidium sp. 428]